MSLALDNRDRPRLHISGSRDSSASDSAGMVAIVTEENGNVYYEIGLAYCQNIPVVLLTSDARSLKFDLRDHRAIIYDDLNPEVVFEHLLETLIPLSRPTTSIRMTISQAYWQLIRKQPPSSEYTEPSER